MSFADQAAKAAAVAFSRLGRPTSYIPRDSVTASPVTAVLRRAIEREQAGGDPYLVNEITVQASDVPQITRGDIFVVDGARWIVDAPARNTGYILSAIVIPDEP